MNITKKTTQTKQSPASVNDMRDASNVINRERQMGFSTSPERGVKMAVVLNTNIHLSVLKAMEHRAENRSDPEMMEQIARAKLLCDYRKNRLLGLIRPTPGHKEKLGLAGSDHHDDLAHLHLEDHNQQGATPIGIELRKEIKIPNPLILAEPIPVGITIRTVAPA